MGLCEVSAGAQGIEAQSSAGFASPSVFRIAFAQLLGVSPGCLPENAPLKADCLNTPLGQMLAVADDSALHLLEFVDRRARQTNWRGCSCKQAVRWALGVVR